MLNKSSIALALSLALSNHAVAVEALVVDSKTDLGSLATGNNRHAFASKVSADGLVVVGYSQTDSGNPNAFVWRESVGMTALGTLRANNSGYSIANGVSADGHVVVGAAQTDNGTTHAFIWRNGDSKMTSLGTLKADNSGYSNAYGVSAGGRVVVGYSNTDIGDLNAFIWREGDSKMTNLGTLATDNSGYSIAYGVSADGRVVVGDAGKAFIWREGDSQITSLGTLRADNSGYSGALAVSADGRVVVGGSISDNNSYYHAFIWREGDSKMTNLSILGSNPSQGSIANGVSADGSVVVGMDNIDSGSDYAFIWREGDTKLTNLGTLNTNNSGYSSANGVSADGTVVVGISITDNLEYHAVVWKVKYPVPPVVPPIEPPVIPPIVPPVVPPIVTIVDATNSNKAMADTGRRSFKVLDLYQGSLNNLSQSRCQLDQSDYCVGIFSQYDAVSSNHRSATGLFSTVRLPAENWIVGAAINFANGTHLVDNYDIRGSNRPGVGGFTRYQQNRDNTGFNAELSGAFLQQSLTITRDKLQNTEAGEGNSRINGFQASLSGQYGMVVSPTTIVSPSMTLTRRKVIRDGYTETRNTEFAATYGKLGNNRTELKMAVNTIHQLNEIVQLDGNVGATMKLHSERDAFTGRIPYIGAYAYDAGNERNVSPYATAGINVNVTPNSTVRANVGWQQADYHHDAANMSVSYSYHW